MKNKKYKAKDNDSFVLNTAGAVMPDPSAKSKSDSERDIRKTFMKNDKKSDNDKSKKLKA